MLVYSCINFSFSNIVLLSCVAHDFSCYASHKIAHILVFSFFFLDAISLSLFQTPRYIAICAACHALLSRYKSVAHYFRVVECETRTRMRRKIEFSTFSFYIVFFEMKKKKALIFSIFSKISSASAKSKCPLTHKNENGNILEVG